MAHRDAREWKWSGNWRMAWVASTLHTTSECGVSSITTGDAHISAAHSRLNWRPRWFKRTRPFRRKTKSGFCVCAIAFQTQSTASNFTFLFLDGNDDINFTSGTVCCLNVNEWLEWESRATWKVSSAVVRRWRTHSAVCTLLICAASVWTGGGGGPVLIL